MIYKKETAGSHLCYCTEYLALRLRHAHIIYFLKLPPILFFVHYFKEQEPPFYLNF